MIHIKDGMKGHQLHRWVDFINLWNGSIRGIESIIGLMTGRWQCWSYKQTMDMILMASSYLCLVWQMAWREVHGIYMDIIHQMSLWCLYGWKGGGWRGAWQSSLLHWPLSLVRKHWRRETLTSWSLEWRVGLVPPWCSLWSLQSRSRVITSQHTSPVSTVSTLPLQQCWWQPVIAGLSSQQPLKQLTREWCPSSPAHTEHSPPVHARTPRTSRAQCSCLKSGHPTPPDTTIPAPKFMFHIMISWSS